MTSPVHQLCTESASKFLDKLGWKFQISLFGEKPFYKLLSTEKNLLFMQFFVYFHVDSHCNDDHEKVKSGLNLLNSLMSNSFLSLI